MRWLGSRNREEASTKARLLALLPHMGSRIGARCGGQVVESLFAGSGWDPVRNSRFKGARRVLSQKMEVVCVVKQKNTKMTKTSDIKH